MKVSKFLKRPTVLAILAALLASAAGAAAEPSSFNLLDSGEKGVFNIGPGNGYAKRSFDETLNKDVLQFDYSVPKGSIIGVWTKSYPPELTRDAVDAVNIGVNVPNPEELRQVSVKVEIKGDKTIQTIPLQLETGWNTIREPINWSTIGNLREAVFVVSPMGEAASVEGVLYFFLDFVKSPPAQKKSPHAQIAAPLAALKQKTSAIDSAQAAAEPSSFNLLDSGEKGVFNIGPGNGYAKRSFDETLNKDVLQFDYSVPKGSIIGVWTKSYPPELTRDAVDAVNIGVNVPNPEELRQVSVKVEIKGDKTIQTIPLQLETGWNTIREPINWSTIGNLREAVFVVVPITAGVVSPMGGAVVSPTEEAASVEGRLYFNLDFYKLAFWQKDLAFIKVGLLLIFSFLMAWIVGLLGRLLGRRRLPPQHITKDKDKNGPKPSLAETLSRFKPDFFYGMVAVLIAGIALHIYFMGTVGPLDAGFSLDFLAVGLAGAVIAGVLKLSFTGGHLSPIEVFQDILLTGLLAVASGRQELLQSPSSWTEILMLSNLTAAIDFLIYHIYNACSLASSGRHLKAITGALIVGTPFLFGWLLLLENVDLLQALSNGITAGLLSAWPAILEMMGRLLVVFGFNEALMNGISLATKGRTIIRPRAHLVVLAVSSAVVVSPLIANLGSTAAVAALPVAIRSVIAVVTTMLSHAGLWGQVYLMTGMVLDSTHRRAPSVETVFGHAVTGARKGMAYSGILMALLYGLNMLLGVPGSRAMMAAFPIAIGSLAGALVFPLIKTIIETFDGSQAFFDRVRYSYRSATLYARGAVAGFGFAYMITQGLFQEAMPDRIVFGLIVGLFASAGVSILRDAVYAFRNQGQIQSWRLYFIDGLLGIFVGSAAAFYLDSSQVPVIVEKFKLYTSAGSSAVNYITYPLVSKWGRIDLGSYTGGVKLLFIEALAGVINWSVAAWLFAINRVFMEAYFNKDKSPIRFFFSKAGFVELIKHMIYVLRWGLWMSPIIFTFLRMMPNPTWYNQDGAIHTLFAIFHNATMSPEAFREWSLKIFIYVLAFDFFRILIWMDHMGLRVATLVNLSFIGLDRLDERIGRFIGRAAAQRYIPEAVKRFATWAPLLIPFYLPRGQDWDYAWSASEAMRSARGAGALSVLQSLALPQMLFLIVLAILACAGISYLFRSLRSRSRRREKVYELSNREYKTVLKQSGAAHSEVLHNGYDVSRRSYDTIDPCGRVLYLADASQEAGGRARSWPVIGNFPNARFEASSIEKDSSSFKVVNTSNGVRTTVDISLPEADTPAEIWTVTVENMTDRLRRLKIVPYLEWVLGRALDDRFHTQYARLFPEMEYLSGVNAILARRKNTKSIGILAADCTPEGFLTSRMDFIGRARSIWAPRALETLNFLEARDTTSYPTFDPIGSLMLSADMEAISSRTIRIMIGYAGNKEEALDLIKRHLRPRAAKAGYSSEGTSRFPLIGHGEIPSGTPQPYATFVDDGNKLLIHTPYTPRPFDHGMSNAMGHSVSVTNRGLHTSCNGNSQQNRLTPDWPDTVTREVPSEAIYLYDPDRDEWYSPTYHPLNDANAQNEAEFGVDGTAVFRMRKGGISSELTVFVPPNDPTGIYLLTIKNNDDRLRRIRVSPYFQMVLSFQPEQSGPIDGRYDRVLNALFFENPRNTFRKGQAFAYMSAPAECVETKRGKFFGENRGVAHPFMVEKGVSDVGQTKDDRPIAGFLATLKIPAHGERTVGVLLGQTDNRKEAVDLIRKYKSIAKIRASLEDTKKWWLSLMGTLEIETNNPEFDRFQNWLKYQALAERIWARRGFYQTSGAFGFRDQLQDAVNLMWVDASLARKQIVLHASQQFIEGDVFHWFFTLTDGRSAFAFRSHASDNPLWIAWGVVEYIRATGDYSVLDEMTSYVVSENPFQPLPKNKQGWGGLYHRSTKAGSVYKHCLKSIDLVLEKRTGEHGLPLIGTGDWNDGLDEIGSEGRGESVWLGFFLYYILKDMVNIIGRKEGPARKEYYLKKMQALEGALELTWRDDRYLRAIHDDGTEIGVKDSGIWEIDALTAAWAVISGINPERGRIVFHTALRILERENVVLLGWPALREDTKPYLGRSSKYPEGVRENGMYCHGVQWLIKAARILAEWFDNQGESAKADEYRETAYRLWLKITPISHVTPQEIEIYGGQPNKQPADILTTFDQGRMIWNGYTGAAGWLFREALEGVVGVSLLDNTLVLPDDLDKPRGRLKVTRVRRDVGKSPLKGTQ